MKYGKKDVIEGIYNYNKDITKKDIKEILDLFIVVIKEEVSYGNEILLKGFGKFYKKTRSARMGRDPRNGNKAHCPESNILGFKGGADL